MDEYFNRFRVQGKRIRHIDRIEGTKLYIGIRSLAENFEPFGGKRQLELDQSNLSPEKAHIDKGEVGHEKFENRNGSPFKAANRTHGGLG